MPAGHLAVVGTEAGAAPGGLHVETRWEGKRAVLAVAGDLDVASAPVLREALAAVTAGRPTAVELDLSAATVAGEPPLVRLVEASRWTGGEDSLAVLGAAHCVREVAAVRALPEVIY